MPKATLHVVNALEVLVTLPEPGVGAKEWCCWEGDSPSSTVPENRSGNVQAMCSSVKVGAAHRGSLEARTSSRDHANPRDAARAERK